MTEVTDIARAFHCPQDCARRVLEHKKVSYRMIFELGPMRVFWRRGVGWLLDNKPATLAELANERHQWARRARIES